jgi:RNA polymerase sigma-70 factor, ECF subfamily
MFRTVRARRDIGLSTVDGQGGAFVDGPSGSLESLRLLYDLHAAEIERFCRRALGERPAAEEAMQDTFLKAWRNLHRFDPSKGSQRAWLFSIARNTTTDMLRARRVRPALAGVATDGSRETAAPGEIDDVITGWMVEEALRRIRPDHRAAIVETHIRGRSYAEVSAELGVPEATLRTRSFYGLKALRLALEEMGWHE